MNRLQPRAVLLAVAATIIVGALLLWLGRDSALAPASAARRDAAARCGDGVVNAPNEQCDGTAFAEDAPAGARCGRGCRLEEAQSRCGNSKLDPFEQCDGTLFRMPEDRGSTCDATCTVVPPAGAGPKCGDGKLNQPHEECDGETLPEDAPEGASCSRRCTLIEAEENECQQCVERSCVAQRAEVDENLGEAGPLLECVLGKDWARWSDVPAQSCAREDLLTCYCGTTPGQDCATSAPSSLKGPCVPESLVATDCTTSQCVATRFMSLEYPSGIALRYAMCAQDNCYERCF